ncbi:ryanodine-inositol 1,4,5-triphosphate receptor Ca2 channel (RIR-CaC) family protein [Phytophthora infestans T30-4]|uniref:Ryanodine-inositol 1,4,5-triphosphate receptor Ca2 channel (RIR-CaC) family protein n=1 Tax=Phytophthora infestans (strain T30-4) TaxID=403677 RepID=D0MQE0_PHYIT|nr:ryanodine-inositol 1,4,5-triphosphate receptor Ca2 channel (RIR-CaC) family protein [Phytophthora infestans T30-4]EEY57709.1 ryanodine-inositol 1,4,5-triphosphate receptor Ca2 channel (RIR-CaC) family protein [Phytophthora infestans T30-4]|eukprot:XP_002908895.1 ryanodine-inositol 1,4,5-triphosphate receptor Ca2 channel (RIR-CaC) family protein [Phytophthora infestans T30-4]
MEQSKIERTTTIWDRSPQKFTYASCRKTRKTSSSSMDADDAAPVANGAPAAARAPPAPVSTPTLSVAKEEPAKPRNGAPSSMGAFPAASDAPVPLKPKPKPTLRTPPSRLRSGSGSGSNTSSGRERRESGGPRPASANMGIVVGTLRRRNRVNLRTSSLSDEEANDVVSVPPRSTAMLAPRRSKKQPSLRNMASLVRSHLRSSKSLVSTSSESTDVDVDADADTDKNPGLERSNSSFAGVAQQLVTSRRAARGFLSMWTKDSTETMHVYRGIHMEKKKLDLVSVASEYKEIKRRQFYQELVVYVVFLTFLFSLLSWLPVQDSFHQNDVVGALTCREEGECEIKTFADIYDFAGKLRDTVCERQDVTAQWVRVGGVGFRQVRVKELRCRVYDGWEAPCYPFYSPEAEQKTSILGENGTGRVYEWRDGLGDLSPEMYRSAIDWLFFGPVPSYGSGGYAVDLCDLEDVEELQRDHYLSEHTRAAAFKFILLNPITRVFTIGMHVITVDPSGHIDHFAHSSHVRVIGHEKPEQFTITDDSVEAPPKPKLHRRIFDALRGSMSLVREAFDVRVLLWVALVLFFITYCIGEATEMSTMGVSTYLGSDMWNLFELSHLVVLAAMLSYMVHYYMASSSFALHLAELREGRGVEELSHTSSQELLTGFQQLSDLASLGSAISLLKVFKFLRMNATLNLLWRVLGMAMSDLMGFLVIFNLIFLGYSAMGSYAFGFALEEYSTISKSYGTCFQMLAGEMDYGRLQQANPRVAPLFIGTFVVLVFQILVNMFVAILSEYYEVAKNDETASGEDVEYDVLARIRSFVSACSPTVVVPKDHGVIRLIPWQQVRLISTNLVDQEETRQRVRKLFRGAVWRVVALLRFGMKFDRRINFGDRKTHDGSTHNGNGGSPGGKEDRELVSHIRLSENFDHKTIKEMIPIGITIRLQGDSILGDGLALKVVHHGKLSVECIVLGPNEAEAGSNAPGKINGGLHAFAPPRTISSLGSFEDDSDLDDGAPRERVLELMGGEKLRIPRRRLAVHLCRIMFQELKNGLLRATKLWNYSKDHMVDDYHLGLLFDSVRADGRTSLRFDEISRMLDLFLRKDKRKAMCSQAEVRREALQVMYRFRKCLIDMPSREKEGHNYRPKPVDTSKVELGHLEHLGDVLARNCHDMWALERLKQGWQYGEERDDKKKRHPNLVPYKLLSVEEQAFDYRSSIETIKTIVFMNYAITRANHQRSHSGSFHDSVSRSASTMSDIADGMGGSNSSLLSGGSESTSPRANDAAVFEELGTASHPGTPARPVPSLLREAMSFRRNSLMGDSPYFTSYGEGGVEVYRPLPIDTTTVELPPRLLRLVDLLAENAHEVWAKGRMDEGWTYGPQRDDSTKKHPCLVPYVFLTDDEKEYDINIAKETLKTLIAMKFTILDRSSKY